MLWEQEMYTPISYMKQSKNFHFFAADVSVQNNKICIIVKLVIF
jgi:hypothetical protein